MSIYIIFFCINFNQVFYPKDNIGFPLIFIKHLGFVKVIGFNLLPYFADKINELFNNLKFHFLIGILPTF